MRPNFRLLYFPYSHKSILTFHHELFPLRKKVHNTAQKWYNKNMKNALIKTFNSFKQFIPIILGILLLLSLALTAIPKSFYTMIFTGNKIIDPLVGALLGSISGGNPITSYVLGGEFLNINVSLLAVTAFILAWVTVGIIQLPAEILMLGKKFAITRNVISFFMAMIIAILTVLTLAVICVI